MSHWQSKTKLRSTDTQYSLYIRTKAHWICARCGLNCSGDHQYLTTSHYHGRKKESVRFDERNCQALCRKCHEFFEGRKESEYKPWLIERLGQREFDILLIDANTTGHRDDAMQKIINKELLKSLEVK